MVAAGQKRIFIYGNFVDEAERSSSGRARRILSGNLPSIAIEILREFSALEMIGKIYVMTRERNWAPVTPSGVSQFEWYKTYQQTARRTQGFFFEEGADLTDIWRVLYIRQESDEVGSYMAVALRHDSMRKLGGKLSDLA
jgi:hypothetical protein